MTARPADPGPPAADDSSLPGPADPGPRAAADSSSPGPADPGPRAAADSGSPGPADPGPPATAGRGQAATTPGAANRPGEPSPGRGFGPDFLTDLFRFPLDPGYADADARRRRHGPRTGWRRGALRVGSAVTAAAIGVLLVTAYRQTLAAEPGRSQARAGLVSQVQDRQAVTDALQRRVDGLRDQVARQRDAVLAGNEATRLRNLEAVTGLARVRGDGVVVTVDDAPSAVDAVTGAGQGQDLGRVFDQDLQNIANALWAAGAEAVAINGQRLTATTTIRSAGRAILVDFRPVTRPYKISAIGPGDMARRFDASPTAELFNSLAHTYGMSYGVREADGLTLPSAAEPRLRFARPVAPPSGAPGTSTSPSSGRQPAGATGAVPQSNPPGGGP